MPLICGFWLGGYSFLAAMVNGYQENPYASEQEQVIANGCDHRDDAQGGAPNYTRFMEEMRSRDPAGTYSLSNKTFLRDIDDLKIEFGAPIDYDASARGFFLRDKEWYSENLLAEPFDMQGVRLAQV